jgi:hypothetical protein
MEIERAENRATLATFDAKAVDFTRVYARRSTILRSMSLMCDSCGAGAMRLDYERRFRPLACKIGPVKPDLSE